MPDLDSWLTEADLPVLLSSINRIYQPADVHINGSLQTHDCVGLGTCPGQPVPTSSGAFTPACARAVVIDTDYRSSQATKTLVRNAIFSQLDPDHIAPAEFHVWLLPYIGKTSQGRANREPGWGAAVTVGLWSDKYGSLTKRALTGGETTEIGSLAKTVAHELGHSLGIGHGGPSTRLMSSFGTPQGVELTADDVNVVRDIAATGSPRLKPDSDSVPKTGMPHMSCP